MPPELFIPDGPGGTLKDALDCCNGEDGRPVCPVRSQCAIEGKENNEVGVWGGEVRSSKMKRTPVDIIQDARLKKA